MRRTISTCIGAILMWKCLVHVFVMYMGKDHRPTREISEWIECIKYHFSFAHSFSNRCLSFVVDVVVVANILFSIYFVWLIEPWIILICGDFRWIVHASMNIKYKIACIAGAVSCRPNNEVSTASEFLHMMFFCFAIQLSAAFHLTRIRLNSTTVAILPWFSHLHSSNNEQSKITSQSKWPSFDVDYYPSVFLAFTTVRPTEDGEWNQKNMERLTFFRICLTNPQFRRTLAVTGNGRWVQKGQTRHKHMHNSTRTVWLSQKRKYETKRIFLSLSSVQSVVGSKSTISRATRHYAFIRSPRSHAPPKQKWNKMVEKLYSFGVVLLIFFKKWH